MSGSSRRRARAVRRKRRWLAAGASCRRHSGHLDYLDADLAQVGYEVLGRFGVGVMKPWISSMENMTLQVVGPYLGGVADNDDTIGDSLRSGIDRPPAHCRSSVRVGRHAVDAQEHLVDRACYAVLGQPAGPTKVSKSGSILR